jgi:hypothetical protein
MNTALAMLTRISTSNYETTYLFAGMLRGQTE